MGTTDFTTFPNRNQPNNTLAPSEKHLEDWIVANLACFGESMDNPEGYDYGDVIYTDDDRVIFPYFADIVAEQFHLPSGIPDLIGYATGSVAPIEIKKGAITYDVVGQCLRYMHDLMEVLYWVFMDAVNSDNPDRKSYWYTPLRRFELSEYPDAEITGMVVGHSFSDKNIPIVCAACNIQVVTYEYTGTEYRFTLHPLERPHHRHYIQLVDSKVGQAIRRALLRRAENQRRGNNE